MHGCNSGSVLLVNAEVDSMGGVVEGGVGVATIPSPQRAAIEQAQAELRQHYDSREVKRRELEFLEKGGNPLDFKYVNATSVSVQSTSLTDQHPEQFVASEAKGSFALTASPRADSVESSGRLGAPSVCEPNSADNLMLFDGDNEFREVERNSVHLRRNNIVPLEQFSQLDSGQNAKESGESAAFGHPKKAYKRRNRTRPNRDGARSSSTDAVPSRGGHAFLPSRHASRDTKGSVQDADNEERNFSSNSNSKPTSPNASVVLKTLPSDNRMDIELADVQVVESAIGPTKESPSAALSDTNVSKILQDNQVKQSTISDALVVPVNVASEELESFRGIEQAVSASPEYMPCAEKVENQANSGQMNGYSSKGERKSIPNEGQNSSVRLTTKGMDSESSCTQTSRSLDGPNGSEVHTSKKNSNSDGIAMEQTLASREVPDLKGNRLVTGKDETKTDDVCAVTNDKSNSFHRSQHENGPILKSEEESKGTGSTLQNEFRNTGIPKEARADGCTASEKERKPTNLLGSTSASQDGDASMGRLQGSNDSSIPKSTLSVKGFTVATEPPCSENNMKLASKAHEDSILEEARIIEAKRKRIAELSVGTLPSENRRKTHWDFVLEEMAWLANDFAQERLWKITAASQVSRRAALRSQLRFREQNSLWKPKGLAHTLAEAVLEFWRTVQETSKEMELQCPVKDIPQALRGYAGRFLKYNSSNAQYAAAEAPVTPDRISDLGILDISWEDNLTEENLFYTVPAGAIEAYRKSIESHLLQREKTGSSLHEEVETSAYDTVADFGSQVNAYEEDEGETGTYYLPGAFEGSKAQKKRKNFNSYGARPYEMGADIPFMQCVDNNIGTQQSALVVKRPTNSLNVSIPTKRVRTASRQRVLSPFSAGTSGCVQAPSRTDASSGDTNSFQDDQSTLHGGHQISNNLEAESVADFDKQLHFDSTEVSNRPKKKKKAKHLRTYEHRWQLDSNFQNDQRDYSKRRLESHQFESNGSSGLYGQHIMKKPKTMRQTLENSFDNLTPTAGSNPSPVASQMSNMSNPNKFIKLLGVRDRGRKAKALKTPAGQSGSGSPWSLFEDQALVVLVHDMGPNWELVSDAINSTLQFKCIFRKSNECKERHKILMDRSAGDGADSAEDSGLSQPYPSTLPGIPQGSARQLFQRLQGPMEEDTLKNHFEKIIMIGKKQHYRRTQNDNQDPKQLQQPHSSHALALSQVCPNNLNGGPVLTPLDLCDATAPSSDILPLGYQAPHTSGLPMSNQGTLAPVVPASGPNSSIQGSSNVILGNNFSSPPGQLNASVRDGRYGIPRTTSLSIDEQQRMQQYNQMLSARNIQQSNVPVPGGHPGTDPGVRMLPGGNGMGIMSGLNRNMPMARPGYPGITSSSMLNSGSMLSSGMVAMPNHVNMHSGPGPGPGPGQGQGNSMLRPRNAMHMMRPNQNTEHQRQMMVPELQMQQVSQSGSNQGVPPFVGGLSSSFPNPTVSPPVQSYPLHHNQPHPMSPQQPSHMLGSNSHHPHHLQGPPNHTSNTQQQAYAIRFAKERHIQQQRLLQQQQFATSNALMSQPQPPQSQLPMSSPQNSTQINSQNSPQVSMSPMATSSSMSPMPQHTPQKHHVPQSHGLVRNPQTGGSQMGKQQRQRQPQQFQQAGRHHPQQRQPAQSQQQGKLSKGGGRGSMMMHQNLPMDPSLLNGFSGSQSAAEKGEQQVSHHLVQGGHGSLFPGSAGLNPVVQSSSKQSGLPHSSSNHLQPQQQKTYSGQAQAAPAKQLQQQKPSHSSDSSNNQAHVSQVVVSSGTPSVMVSSNHQQPQPHVKLANQTPPTANQRVIQQNRQMNSSDPQASKPQSREVAQAEQPPVSLKNSSQMSSTPPTPHAHGIDATISEVQPVASSGSGQWNASEPLYESPGVMPEHATQLGKSSIRTIVPLTSTAGTGNEPSGPIGSQGLVQRQSSSDSLPNSGGHDVGVQWQQQQQQPSS